MLQKLLLSVFKSCMCVWALLLATQTAQAQEPLLYLHVAKPGSPLLVSTIKDSTSVLVPLQKKLQSNGYQVVTHPDTLRKLLAHSPKRPLFYADVVCFQIAASNPTVIFAVRDTLGKPWFTSSEEGRVFISPQKAFSGAAEYLAKKIPATFTSRFGHASPATRGPQFVIYETFDFASYLYPVLRAASVRQQLKQGSVLELTLHIDEMGFATLKSVDGQLTLDAATRQMLEAALQNTPPWSPALVNGRRTAVDFYTKIGRGNMPKPVAGE